MPRMIQPLPSSGAVGIGERDAAGRGGLGEDEAHRRADGRVGEVGERGGDLHHVPDAAEIGERGRAAPPPGGRGAASPSALGARRPSRRGRWRRSGGACGRRDRTARSFASRAGSSRISGAQEGRAIHDAGDEGREPCRRQRGRHGGAGCPPPRRPPAAPPCAPWCARPWRASAAAGCAQRGSWSWQSCGKASASLSQWP